MTPELFKKCNPPFKVPAVEVRNVHLSQAKGFSPVWVLSCLAKSFFVAKTEPQNPHIFWKWNGLIDIYAALWYSYRVPNITGVPNKSVWGEKLTVFGWSNLMWYFIISISGNFWWQWGHSTTLEEEKI